MVSTARVAYLWLLLAAGTFFTCFWLLSDRQIARFSSERLGVHALDTLRQHGELKLYWHSVGAGVREAAPYLMLGGAVGLLCRAIMYLRAVRRRRATEGTHSLSDRFGVRLTMTKGRLAHNPDCGVYRLPEAREGTLPRGLSPVERDALALLALHQDVPADCGGVHGGVSLAQHSMSVWRRACNVYGVGSLPAMIALTHDLGKTLAFRREGNTWVADYGHRPLTLQAVQRLPGLARLEAGKRSAYMRLLTALVTRATPVEATEWERAVLRTSKGFDYAATAEERVETQGWDAAALAQLLLHDVVKLLEGLNVNRKLDASRQPDGLFEAKTRILFLSEAALRQGICKMLPADVVHEARLDARPGSIAERREIIGQIAQVLFDVLLVVRERAATDGYFRVRSAFVRFDRVLAIDAKDFPEQVTQRWGSWSYEIDLD